MALLERSFAGRSVDRFIELEGVDRAVALASRAFHCRDPAGDGGIRAVAGRRELRRANRDPVRARGRGSSRLLLRGAWCDLEYDLDDPELETGAADTLAEALVGLGEASPYAVLLGLVVLTMGLGQLISNTATALIVIPIAVSAASASPPRPPS